MKSIVNAAVGYVAARLSEPSTWAAIAAALVGVFPQLKDHLGAAQPFVLAVAAALGFALPERRA